MKCPKCGYISFDHHDSCPKCKKNISATQGQLNLPDFEIKTPAFLVGMAAQAGGGAAIPIHEADETVVVETFGADDTVKAVDPQDKAVPDIISAEPAVDFDELKLIPDDDGSIKPVDLDQLTDVETEIDLAINNLEADDLLSIDDFAEAPESSTPGRQSVDEHIGGKLEDADLTLDLEDLELELELDGEGGKK